MGSNVQTMLSPPLRCVRAYLAPSVTSAEGNRFVSNRKVSALLLLTAAWDFFVIIICCNKTHISLTCYDICLFRCIRKALEEAVGREGAHLVAMDRVREVLAASVRSSRCETRNLW